MAETAGGEGEQGKLEVEELEERGEEIAWGSEEGVSPDKGSWGRGEIPPFLVEELEERGEEIAWERGER